MTDYIKRETITKLCLHNPLTEEEWDMIMDVHFDKTDRIVFRANNGKEVEFLKITPADVKPVVRGKWIKDDYPVKIPGAVYPTHRCSACGDWNYNAIDNFCPHCGADMREDKA